MGFFSRALRVGGRSPETIKVFELYKYDRETLLKAIELARSDILGDHSDLAKDLGLSRVLDSRNQGNLPRLALICPRGFIMIVWALMAEFGTKDITTPQALSNRVKREYEEVLSTLKPFGPSLIGNLRLPEHFDKRALIDWKENWREEIGWWMEDGRWLGKDNCLGRGGHPVPQPRIDTN